ncbi:MAG: ABC transporter permease [Blastocatellia bacterium]|nr:ABC transporter permease [Blastocatellia bacterium]
MNDLFRDVLYGLRTLRKAPGFTLIAIFTLALGIGATTAIFSVVNAVLLRSLPLPKAERLMTIWEDYRAKDGPELEWTSPTGFSDWRDQAQSFDHVAAWQGWQPTLTGQAEPEQLIGATVSYNTLEMLGVLPNQGRTFRKEEDQRGAEKVVILSHGLWQRRFGGDPSLIGKPISLMGENWTVVGVMPAGFQFPVIPKADLYRTLMPSLGEGCQRGCLTLRVIARLKEGVTEMQARSELETLARNIAQQFPESNAGVGVTLKPLHDYLTRDVKTPMYALLGAVALLLLIACANVANLLLARSATREKEIAIRAALGAGRGRIVRQLLAESVLLALIGGGLGLLVSYWMVDLLVSFSPDGTPRLSEVVVDRRVLGFSLGLSVLTGLLFGLAPAWQISRTDVHQSLRDSGKGTPSAQRGRRALGAMVVAETALALMLLVGAGLLMKSFVQLQRVDPGFNPNGVLTAVINLPRANYPERPKVIAFYQQLLERVSALPGVQSAGAVSSLPMGGFNSDTGIVIEGRPAPPPNQQPGAWFSSVSLDYFRTMATPLRAGRWFTERDNAQSPKVIIVNETFVRRYYPNDNPIGKRIGDGRPDGWREIVGVVGDVKHFGLSEESRPSMFFPDQQAGSPRMVLVMRTSNDPLSLTAAVRGAVASLDNNLAVATIKTMEQVTAESIATPRFTLLIFGLFSTLALLLAAAGIYGVMSYSVTERTHEIGIRMALGASVRDVLQLIIGQGLKLTLLGTTIGLLAAWGLTRWMKSLLFDVSATDPITFVVVAILLGFVAFLACYLPARRATKVDPMIALRCE